MSLLSTIPIIGPIADSLFGSDTKKASNPNKNPGNPTPPEQVINNSLREILDATRAQTEILNVRAAEDNQQQLLVVLGIGFGAVLLFAVVLNSRK